MGDLGPMIPSFLECSPGHFNQDLMDKYLHPVTAFQVRGIIIFVLLVFCLFGCKYLSDYKAYITILMRGFIIILIILITSYFT